MNFEEYLISKKIDNARFYEKEQALWDTWKVEFEQMHPNSFTVQKLNLINPIRRKYPLKIQAKPVETSVPEVKETSDKPEVQPMPESKPVEQAKPVMPKPAIARPVFKPKPKID